MSVEKEREAFEAYYIANHHDGDIHPNQQLLEWSEKGEFYFASSVNDLWDMWYASANREGYKLVPIKCTNNMAHAAKEVDGRLSAFKYGDVWEAMIGACDD